MNKKILTATGLLLATLAVAVAVSIPTYYVSQNGTGTACTESNPCSYAEGIKQVQPGQRVIVLGTITSPINLNKSGAARNPITFEGGVYDGATVNGCSGCNVVTVSGSYIVVKDAEIKNAYGFGIRTTGDYIELDNLYVHHSVRRYYNGTTCTNTSGGWEAGVRVSPGSDFVTVKNSRSWNNCGEGIGLLDAENATIINNDVRNNWSVNIYIDQSNYATVTDNLSICDNPNYYRSGVQSRGVTFGAEGYGSGNIIGAQVLRNTVQGCKGVYFYAQVAVKLQDSTIANNDLSQVVGVGVSLPSNTIGTNVNIYGNIGSVSAPGATLTAGGTVLPATRTATPSRTPVPATVTRTATPTRTPAIIPSVTPECKLFTGRNVIVCLP